MPSTDLNETTDQLVDPKLLTLIVWNLIIPRRNYGRNYNFNEFCTIVSNDKLSKKILKHYQGISTSNVMDSSIMKKYTTSEDNVEKHSSWLNKMNMEIEQFILFDNIHIFSFNERNSFETILLNIPGNFFNLNQSKIWRRKYLLEKCFSWFFWGGSLLMPRPFHLFPLVRSTAFDFLNFKNAIFSYFRLRPKIQKFFTKNSPRIVTDGFVIKFEFFVNVSFSLTIHMKFWCFL